MMLPAKALAEMNCFVVTEMLLEKKKNLLIKMSYLKNEKKKHIRLFTPVGEKKYFHKLTFPCHLCEKKNTLFFFFTRHFFFFFFFFFYPFPIFHSRYSYNGIVLLFGFFFGSKKKKKKKLCLFLNYFFWFLSPSFEDILFFYISFLSHQENRRQKM